MTRNILIGAEVSLYTGKVRAYLRYKDIPFDEVIATSDVYRSVIMPRTGVRFIPVLISDDDIAVQDSTAIIEFLEQRHPRGSIFPESDLQRLVALVFEVYADEWLLLPAMHYRWNVAENRAFAIEEFGRLAAPDASPEEQRAIGEKRASPFAGALPALGVQAETVPAIEASYRGFLDDFDQHLAAHPFLLGTRPSIGDFALFGPLYAHLYRDPASGRMMQQVAPRVADWVLRMRTPVPLSGEFLPNDALPKTLEPLLARAFHEFGPVLENTIERVASVPRDRADTKLPRTLGMHAFQLGEARGERAIYPFNLWRWQRAFDHHRQLSSDSRAHADALLERVDGQKLMHTPITCRLARRHNHLVFESEPG